MFPVPLKADDPLFLPLGLQTCPVRSRRDQKAALLNYMARSKRLVAVRPASGLEVRPRPHMLPTGIAEVDSITGGFPCGCLTEICGPASSGKTSLLIAAMAAATCRAESCALIDASDSFDPASGAAAGLDFNKLLWIRCGVSPRCASLPSVVKGFDHRGTPRVGKDKSSERKLEQVLKTTDLILQSGGFGLVVLDLAGIPENFVRRIPLASWFRFQRAVEPAKTALLVVSESARTQSCAALVIHLSTNRGWGCSPQPSHAQILEGMQIEAEVIRSRLERRPAQSVSAVLKTQAARTG